jgi:hypothetical protein
VRKVLRFSKLLKFFRVGQPSAYPSSPDGDENGSVEGGRGL